MVDEGNGDAAGSVSYPSGKAIVLARPDRTELDALLVGKGMSLEQKSASGGTVFSIERHQRTIS